MKKHILPIFLLLILPSVSFSQEQEKPQEEEKPYVAIIDQDGVQRAAVLGGGYFFKPKHMVVKVGVPVEIMLKKETSITPHNFVLKAPEAGMDISESLSEKYKTVRFTPTGTGNFTYYCDKRFLFFKSHRARGMEGTLEVVK